MSHYLQLQLTRGKDSFDREYFPLTSPEETIESATARWLDAKVKGRQRNIEKARAKARASIEHVRLCHPTSWHEENATGAFAPPGSKPRRRRR